MRKAKQVVVGLFLAGIVFLRADAASIDHWSNFVSGQEPQTNIQDFVGTDTCKVCHPDKFEWFSKTGHFVTVTSSKYAPPNKGCEMCHGPGREHVQAGGQGKIFNPGKAPAGDVAAMCLKCHEEKVGKRNFRQNQHDIKVVSCNDCHNPHQAQTHEYILRDESPNLCYQCHREIRREFDKPFHHKVPEGGMSCRDCHQQHGARNTKQTRDVIGGMDAICTRCHTDKRGPFVFEHAPVRTDWCSTCHVPHGSINNRMLVRSEVRMLCQECHGGRQGTSSDLPQGAHDLTLPRFQNCTNCHVMIHGSNTNRLFFQ
jgi:DmsE family decaheme c-type cytochrome